MTSFCKHNINMADNWEDDVNLQVAQNTRHSWLSPSSWLKWKPTSIDLLTQAEGKILQHLRDSIKTRFVPVNGGEQHLRTICLNNECSQTPLVMMHGMGSGVGLWCLNLEHLSKKRPVYAFDMLGFGRSSRPHFSRDATAAEEMFVESVEDWRKEMKLEKFVLLGHSFGGYLAAAYALKHPDRISNLILVDPWGFPEKPRCDQHSNVPTWIKVVATMLHPFNPFAGLRAAGPWGPGLIQKLRPDLAQKFDSIHDNEEVFNYVYHCNAQNPSGESAFKSMSLPVAWAKNPMINRIADIKKDVSITMIYGSRSWMDQDMGYQTKYLRNSSYVDVQIVSGAGHHVYADKPAIFHKIVDSVCEKVDSGKLQCKKDIYEVEQNSIIDAELSEDQSCVTR